MIISAIRKTIYYLSFKNNQTKFLRKIGMQVGKECRILNDYTDFGSEPYLITLGNHVSISAGTRFITYEGAHWILKGLDAV